MKRFQVPTNKHTQFVNIDREVAHVVRERGVANGVCHIFVPHTTAGITINENADPSVVADIEKILEHMVPWSGDYAHDEGNSAAHVKASLMGSSVTVPIEGGRLALGTWQSIYFCEFDGPRTRQVCVEVVPA
jgi:secondary thiamine-phosphate synthase enzyme